MYKELEAARYAVKKGLITPEQLDECVKLSRLSTSLGLPKSINQILVEKGFLTQEQLMNVLQRFGQALVELGPYSILSKLGEGGMGMIYKARHKKDKKVYALKVLKPERAEDHEFLERFQREVKIAMTLSHPNIVGALEAGEYQGLHYYVMDLVEGRSLQDILDTRIRLEEQEGIRIALQIARALAYANQHRIIHRDIKPSNVIVSREGVARLCDLGIAKPIDSGMTLTRSGYSMGTPDYLSPEQLLDERPDIRSDIYSLGVTLFHMVTGRLPFEGDSSQDTAEMRLHQPPPAPSTFVPKLSLKLTMIILRMLERSASSRYQTPEELIAVLESIVRPDGTGRPLSS